jgi:hypothetical protein
MHQLALIVIGLAIVAFLVSWVVAMWSIFSLRQAVRREGKKVVTVRALFDTRSASSAGYPEARRFMRAMLAGVISWCVGFATGIGSGVFHWHIV